MLAFRCGHPGLQSAPPHITVHTDEEATLLRFCLSLGARRAIWSKEGVE
jgi:hypothetical protein